MDGSKETKNFLIRFLRMRKGVKILTPFVGRPARTIRFGALPGTPFQRKVWRAISQIPYGETRTYQWIARKIGRPKAVRAVGQACKANPTPILVPCHRVVAIGGKLGGFSRGPRLKRQLLGLEQQAKARLK